MSKTVPTFKVHDILLIDGVEYVLGKAYHSVKFQDSSLYFTIRKNGFITPEEVISDQQLNALYTNNRLKFKKEA